MAVRDGRRLSFAEYGSARGSAIVWMHGTPGARRQIPFEARAYADEHGLRIIGIDRPGIGSSTPHLYPDVLDWTHDLALLLDTLAVDTLRIIGLSGVVPTRSRPGPLSPTGSTGSGSWAASRRPAGRRPPTGASSSSLCGWRPPWSRPGSRWASV